MSDLVHPTGRGYGLEPGRQPWSVSRAITRMERTTQVGLARIELQAQLEAHKAQAVGYVGTQALQAVALVSGCEAQLARMCPAAAPRLQGIADVTALSLAHVVADSARRIGG